MKLLDAAELLLGSVVLVAGLGLSALAANVQSFPGVFLGFILFVVGYRLSQVAVRESDESELQGAVSDIVEGAEIAELFMTVVGVGTIAYGFTLLFTSFNRADLLLTAAASALLFTGYVTAHYGINKTLV